MCVCVYISAKKVLVTARKARPAAGVNPAEPLTLPTG